MQTPASFEYERATSVEGAIEALQRLGSEARVIAGGHSLLPMMKLRLANPEHLVDINDLHELAYIREEGYEVADRRAHAARGAAGVRPARAALPDLPRRRAGDRRPGRAQPRHDRRLALPGGRRRGPVRGLLRAQGAGRDPRRASGERVVGLDDFYLGPVHDRRRRRRAPHRDQARRFVRARAALTRRSSGARATGRSRPPRRRSGSRRHHRRRRGRAERGGPDHGPRLARRGAAARQGAVGGAVRSRRARSPRRTARRSRTAAGPSTTSATSRAC